jgi:hypothetical protein
LDKIATDVVSTALIFSQRSKKQKIAADGLLTKKAAPKSGQFVWLLPTAASQAEPKARAAAFALLLTSSVQNSFNAFPRLFENMVLSMRETRFTLRGGHDISGETISSTSANHTLACGHQILSHKTIPHGDRYSVECPCPATIRSPRRMANHSSH